MVGTHPVRVVVEVAVHVVPDLGLEVVDQGHLATGLGLDLHLQLGFR